jgi:hypothetical protein
MELTKLQREIISRAAMAVVGLALLYGGYRCFRVGREFQREFREQRPGRTYRQERRSGDGGLPIFIGVVLVISAVPFGLAAVLPTAWFAKVMGPPNQFPLHENPGSDYPRGPWR